MARLENIDEFIKTGEQPNISSFRRPLAHHPLRAPALSPGDSPRLARHHGGPRSRTAALCRQHGSLAAARAADPRLGAVVVATHSREWLVGQVVDVTIPVDR
jgi:hypothetical protein